MPALSAQQKPIVLDWKDGERTVLVSPADEDRFSLTVQEAAEACRKANTGIIWRNEFDRLLVHLREWLQKHKEIVLAAYGGVVSGKLVFFVIPASERMDFALSDDLAQLELELHQDFHNCECEVRQIPGKTYDALGTFVDLQKAFVLYGNVEATSGTMAS
jgi:hypothetical protein